MSGMGTSDPVLRGIEDLDNERQVNRIMARINERLAGDLDSKVERDIRITMYGWLAFTMELCRQRILDPSIDAGQIADTCAHALSMWSGGFRVFRPNSARRSRPSCAVHELGSKEPSRRVDEPCDPDELFGDIVVGQHPRGQQAGHAGTENDRVGADHGPFSREAEPDR